MQSHCLQISTLPGTARLAHPAFGRLVGGLLSVQVSLGHILRPCLKNKSEQINNVTDVKDIYKYNYIMLRTGYRRTVAFLKE